LDWINRDGLVLNGSFSIRASDSYPGLVRHRLLPAETVTILNDFFDCNAVNATSCFSSAQLTFRVDLAMGITNYMYQTILDQRLISRFYVLNLTRLLPPKR
jgi:hypothetical protein